MHARYSLAVRAVSALSIAIAIYGAILGLGIVLVLSPSTYLADEWWWLSLNLTSAAANVCRLFGHPVILPNLQLYVNHEYFGASALGRALATGASNVTATLLLGSTIIARTQPPRVSKLAVLVTFGAIGLSGALHDKIYWSFGITDALVMTGAAISVHGLAAIGGLHKVRQWLLLIAGGCIATFSFGSGLATWPAFAVALLILRRIREAFIYLAVGIAAISIAMLLTPHCQRVSGVTLLGSIGGLISLNPWTILQTASITLGYLPAHIVGMQSSWATADLAPLWTSLGLVLISALLWLTATLLIKRERDPYLIGLVAIALNLFVATLMIGVTRAPTFGVEVGYQSRYTPISTMFWATLVAFLLRMLILTCRDVLQSAVTFATSTTLLATNVHQVPLFVAVRQHLAVSASAVALAAAENRDSQNLRTYGFSEQILKALPKLVSERKDIFRASATIEAKMPPPAHQCLGTTLLMPQYDEPGVIGIGGWMAGPNRERIKHVFATRGSAVVGIGFSSDLTINLPRQRVENQFLLKGWRAALHRRLPTIASAYGITTGWVGVARMDTLASDLTIIALTDLGTACALPLGLDRR